jgi:hypothetical protein
MANLIPGWYPGGFLPDGTVTPKPTGAALKILNEITSQIKPLEWNFIESSLVKKAFGYFMTYAKSKWKYNGRDCNCTDLAQAFRLTWYGVRHSLAERKPMHRTSLKPDTVLGNTHQYFITKKEYKLFAPADANGNVRDSNGNLNGKCYFPEHWVCQIGSQYFDPTFGNIYTEKDTFIEHKLNVLFMQGERKVLCSLDKKLLYTRRNEVCGPFGDSWNEIEIKEAMKYGGQMPRLPEQEQIPKDIWKAFINDLANPK